MKSFLSKCFSSVGRNQKFEEFSETDPSARNINHPIFKTIKFRKHPSILAIKNNDGLRFHFCRFSVGVLKVIKSQEGCPGF